MKLTKNFLMINQACPDGTKFAEMSGYMGCEIEQLIKSAIGDYRSFIHWLRDIMNDYTFVCNDRGDIIEVRESQYDEEPTKISYDSSGGLAFMIRGDSKTMFSQDGSNFIRQNSNGYSSNVFQNGEHVLTIKPSQTRTTTSTITGGIKVIETRIQYTGHVRFERVQCRYFHNDLELMAVDYENKELIGVVVTAGMNGVSRTDIPVITLDGSNVLIGDIAIVYNENGYTRYDNGIKVLSVSNDEHGTSEIIEHKKDGTKRELYKREYFFTNDKLTKAIVHINGCLYSSLEIGAHNE